MRFSCLLVWLALKMGAHPPCNFCRTFPHVSPGGTYNFLLRLIFNGANLLKKKRTANPGSKQKNGWNCFCFLATLNPLFPYTVEVSLKLTADLCKLSHIPTGRSGSGLTVTMERFLIPVQPAASTPDPAKIVLTLTTRTELSLPTSDMRGKRKDCLRQQYATLFSTQFSLCACLAHSPSHPSAALGRKSAAHHRKRWIDTGLPCASRPPNTRAPQQVTLCYSF